MDPEYVYGVDFSGAKDAGKKIWIAKIDCVDVPRLTKCAPATEYFEVSSDRIDAHRKLTEHLANLDQNTVAGLDFPFSIPQPLLRVDDWETFLVGFPGEFVGPEDFRRRCKSRASKLERNTDEHKRETEIIHGGLPAYHYYLFKQTFYGIRDVIRPLVLSDSVRVPPMQSTDESRPTIIETYPAGVLDEINQNKTHREGYKKSSDESRQKRKTNLELLKTEMDLKIDSRQNNDDLCERILADSEGDGLDAVLAAYGAWRNTVGEGDLGFDEDYDPQEGYIYV